MTDAPYILYGMSASLFTGKVRAYLLHHGIAFEERGAGHPEFTQSIVPKIGRWIIPVVVTPDGMILQDGTDIIDYFETHQAGHYSVVPEAPLLRSIAHLFELFGSEGLLRPAMHYRWNFDSYNLDFLRANFAEAFPPGLTTAQQSAMFDHASGRMRKAGKAFGVSSETQASIEASYATFLSRLNDHLTGTPFLLGDRPTLGDYGLMNGLFAHLARDPYPAMIMKRDAPHVFAWTERMNRPPRNVHSLTGSPDGLFKTVPDTLTRLIQFIADDFLPEITAHIDFTNHWLRDSSPDVDDGPLERSIGMASFNWRGQTLKTAVMPYRFWMLQRLTDHLDQSCKADQTQIRQLFAETGLSALLDHRPERRIIRKDHREVWS